MQFDKLIFVSEYAKNKKNIVSLYNLIRHETRRESEEKKCSVGFSVRISQFSFTLRKVKFIASSEFLISAGSIRRRIAYIIVSTRRVRDSRVFFFVTLSNPTRSSPRLRGGYRPSGSLVFRADDSAVRCRLFPLEFPTDFDTRSCLSKQNLSISSVHFEFPDEMPSNIIVSFCSCAHVLSKKLIE